MARLLTMAQAMRATQAPLPFPEFLPNAGSHTLFCEKRDDGLIDTVCRSCSVGILAPRERYGALQCETCANMPEGF